MMRDQSIVVSDRFVVRKGFVEGWDGAAETIN